MGVRSTSSASVTTPTFILDATITDIDAGNQRRRVHDLIAIVNFAGDNNVDFFASFVVEGDTRTTIVT